MPIPGIKSISFRLKLRILGYLLDEFRIKLKSFRIVCPNLNKFREINSSLKSWRKISKPKKQLLKLFKFKRSKSNNKMDNMWVD